MAVRTTRATGSRDVVLGLAKHRACAEAGIPADRCTDDHLNPEFEGCDRDPPRTRSADPVSR